MDVIRIKIKDVSLHPFAISICILFVYYLNKYLNIDYSLTLFNTSIELTACFLVT